MAVRGRDLGSRKARTLLALLAAERGRLVPVDRIVDVLWPDGPPADPAANVSTLVSRTRRLLGDALTTRAGPGPRAGRRRLVGGPRRGGRAARRRRRSPPLRGARAGRRGLAACSGPARGPAGAAGRGGRRLGPGACAAEADALRARARHLLAASLTATDPPAAVAGRGRGGRGRPVRRARGPGPDARPGRRRTDGGRPRDVRRPGPAPAPGPRHRPGHRDGRPAPRPAAGDARRRTRTAPARDGVPTDPGRSRGGSRHPRAGLEGRGRRDRRAGPRRGRGRDREDPPPGRAADLAASTGGLVLRSRCHPTERSLFLQPYVDALRPALLPPPAAQAAALVRVTRTPGAVLLPELGSRRRHRRDPAGCRLAPSSSGAGRTTRWRPSLRTLAQRAPVLLALDDLQDGGVGHRRPARLPRRPAPRSPGPARRAPSAREDAGAVRRLGDRATVVRAGRAAPLGGRRAGRRRRAVGQHAATVMARTAGHRSASSSACAPSPRATPACRRPSPRPSWRGVDRLDPESRDVLASRVGAGPAAGPAAAGHARRVDRAGGRSGSCEELARVPAAGAQRARLRVRQRPRPGVRARVAATGRWPRPTTDGPPT